MWLKIKDDLINFDNIVYITKDRDEDEIKILLYDINSEKYGFIFKNEIELDECYEFLISNLEPICFKESKYNKLKI